MAECEKTSVPARRRAGDAGQSLQNGWGNPSVSDPHRIPRQIEDECTQRGKANDAALQALLTPHCGHFHSSSLHPSITKGSQQSGKQTISIAAKNIHPPVDNLFLTGMGIPSWPQNGHFDVTGIFLSPLTCSLRLEKESSEH